MDSEDEATPADLAAAFLSRWTGPISEEAEDPLASALGQALEAARREWPGVAVDAEAFAVYLGERADVAPPPLEALARLRTSDLYLACGCARRDPAALAALDRSYFARLPVVIARLGSQAFIEDVLQELKVGLLVGGAPTVPGRIVQYRGWGSLKSWLEISARRQAITRRGSNNTQPMPEALAEKPTADIELEHLRARYSEEFEAALKEALPAALAELSHEDRNLLRWHLVDNISLRKLATMRGVHVSKVARNYARVRSFILEHVRQRLKVQTGLPTRDLQSLMNVLMSQLDVSISGFLP
jgi:RNA polymerase sigma-70 factor (ECF subfamily)